MLQDTDELTSAERSRALREGSLGALLWSVPGLGLAILLGMAMSGPSGEEANAALMPLGRMAAGVCLAMILGGGYLVMVAASFVETAVALRGPEAVGPGEVEARRTELGNARDGVQMVSWTTLILGSFAVLLLIVYAATEGVGGGFALTGGVWILVVWVVGMMARKRLGAALDSLPEDPKTDPEKAEADAAEPSVDPAAARLRSLRQRRRLVWVLILVLTFAMGTFGDVNNPGESRKLPVGFKIGVVLEPAAWMIVMLVVLIGVLAIVGSVLGEHSVRRTQRAWLASCVHDPGSARPPRETERFYLGRSTSLLARALALVAMVPLAFGLALLVLGSFDLAGGDPTSMYAGARRVFEDHRLTGAVGAVAGLAMLGLAVFSATRWQLSTVRLRDELLARWPKPAKGSATKAS